MKRQTWIGEVAITDAPNVVTVTKYAHNSAMNAAVGVLRDHAHGGYWRQEGVSKSDTYTTVDYVHDDGRTARITVYVIA